MKRIALTCMLLTTIAAPAFALQGSECSARAAKLKPEERDGYIKTCLAQADDPANVQAEERKHKSALCEQNAKNKKLQGNDKAAYQSNCVSKNEAAAAATAQPNKVVVANSTPKSTSKSAPRKEGTKQKATKQKRHKKPASTASN